MAVDWNNNRVFFSYSDPWSHTDMPNHLAYYDMANGHVVELTDNVLNHEELYRPRSRYAIFHDIAVDSVNE